MVRGEAQILRRQARADRAFLRRLIREFQDPSQPARLRDLLAFVLGSLPDKEAQDALLGELQATSDARWKAALILALGSLKDDEIDALFDFPDGHFVAKTAGGLSVLVRTVIGDRTVREAMERELRTGPEEVRRASVKALLHTVLAEARAWGRDEASTFEDVRECFLEVLRNEKAADVQAEVADTLAEWAAVAGESPTQGEILAALLEQAAKPESDALRLRVSDSLPRTRLDSAVLQGLLGTAAGSQVPDLRMWALEMAVGQSERQPTDARRAILRVLLETASDPMPKIRETGVRLLRKLPPNPEGLAVLRSALGDRDWAVRKQAVDSLGSYPLDAEARRLLEAAAARDPHEAVRKAAYQQLQKPR